MSGQQPQSAGSGPPSGSMGMPSGQQQQQQPSGPPPVQNMSQQNLNQIVRSDYFVRDSCLCLPRCHILPLENGYYSRPIKRSVSFHECQLDEFKFRCWRHVILLLGIDYLVRWVWLLFFSRSCLKRQINNWLGAHYSRKLKAKTFDLKLMAIIYASAIYLFDTMASCRAWR